VADPVIRMNMNGDLVWDSYHFSFDDGPVQEHIRSWGVGCILEETESTQVFVSAVTATLRLSITQVPMGEGTSPSSSTQISTFVIAVGLFLALFY
jgi:hypothetical protein